MAREAWRAAAVDRVRRSLGRLSRSGSGV